MDGEGQQAAIEDKEMWFDDGFKVSIKQAKNPTDMIWLNRGVSRK